MLKGNVFDPVCIAFFRELCRFFFGSVWFGLFVCWFLCMIFFSYFIFVFFVAHLPESMCIELASFYQLCHFLCLLLFLSFVHPFNGLSSFFFLGLWIQLSIRFFLSRIIQIHFPCSKCALTVVNEYHDNTGRNELHTKSVIMNTVDSLPNE